MPTPRGCPRGDALPTGCPSQGTPVPAAELHPHLCQGLSPAAARPHARVWGCVWGRWPVPAPAPVTSVPSPAPLLPQSRGEPSAPAGSGDGRCSFPVCRLVPPVAAPSARPRRHQPRRPGKFQRRGCRSPGAMVMGAPAVGMDTPTAALEMGTAVERRGSAGRGCRRGGQRKGVGWTDRRLEDTE